MFNGYAGHVAHLVWLILDQKLLSSATKEDIFGRHFNTIGFTGCRILFAIAATSTNDIRLRLGKRGQEIRYGVYVVGVPDRVALLRFLIGTRP